MSARYLKRKVKAGTIQFEKKKYTASFLPYLSGCEVLIEKVDEKSIRVCKLDTKPIGIAFHKGFQQHKEDGEVFEKFMKLENISTNDLVKELQGRDGVKLIKNKADQLLKVTAGENSRIKEKCEAKVLIVRSS